MKTSTSSTRTISQTVPPSIVRSRLAVALIVTALLFLLTGCASTSEQGSTNRRSDVITLEELQEVKVNNLYEAIQRLRPRWLQARSQQSFNTPSQIVVYQNQTNLGGFEALRSLGTDAAHSIQFMDGPTAMASLPGLGSMQVMGAIVIHTTAPRR